MADEEENVKKKKKERKRKRIRTNKWATENKYDQSGQIRCTNDPQEITDTKPSSSNDLFKELFREKKKKPSKVVGGWKSNMRRQNRPEANEIQPPLKPPLQFLQARTMTTMIMGITKALVVAKTPESFLPFFFRHLFISFRSLSAFFPPEKLFLSLPIFRRY